MKYLEDNTNHQVDQTLEIVPCLETVLEIFLEIHKIGTEE